MSILVLKYQENFADNLSEIAYAKILQNRGERKFYFENDTPNRTKFENMMSDFKLDIDYISKSKVVNMAKQSYIFSRNLVNDKQIRSEIQNRRSKDKFLNLPHFRIDDIKYISSDIIRQFEFLNNDFIVNHDILDEINSSNSIGLYLNKADVLNDSIDYDFIFKAVSRLNKYIKQPILYIFSSVNPKIDTQFLNIKHKIISLNDWREEFYFLTRCKNKIIINSQNSYSECFWASVLNSKEYGLYVFDKKIKVKSYPANWIRI